MLRRTITAYPIAPTRHRYLEFNLLHDTLRCCPKVVRPRGDRKDRNAFKSGMLGKANRRPRDSARRKITNNSARHWPLYRACEHVNGASDHAQRA
jgi:hypothetical protein